MDECPAISYTSASLVRLYLRAVMRPLVVRPVVAAATLLGNRAAILWRLPGAGAGAAIAVKQRVTSPAVERQFSSPETCNSPAAPAATGVPSGVSREQRTSDPPRHPRLQRGGLHAVTRKGL